MDKLIVSASFVGLTGALIVGVNLVLLLAMYLAQFGTRVRNGSSPLLFVGIGALREPELISHFEATNGRKAERLNEFEMRSFFALLHVDLLFLLRELIAVWREVRAGLDRSRSGEGLDYRTCAAYIAMRGASYAYLRAWFRRQGMSADSTRS